MGQKVNPHGLRVGIIKDWDSRWYAEDAFADNLVEDDKIRKWHVQNATAREQFLYRHFVLTLITDLQKQIQHMVKSE